MIIDKVNEIIERYYYPTDNCYTAHRYDANDNEFLLKDELSKFFKNNSILFSISSIDGYDGPGFSEDFIAVSFLDENNKLQLIPILFEYY